jgi:hypothetical protein
MSTVAGEKEKREESGRQREFGPEEEWAGRELGSGRVEDHVWFEDRWMVASCVMSD